MAWVSTAVGMFFRSLRCSAAKRNAILVATQKALTLRKWSNEVTFWLSCHAEVSLGRNKKPCKRLSKATTGNRNGPTPHAAGDRRNTEELP
jgi:hypothetical protein